jgi:hypothetical protein
MGTKRVGWARIRSLINENANALKTRLVVEAITANKTLTAADSGKKFTIGTANVAVTLPTVAAAGSGWHCEFWVNDESQPVAITAPGTDLILGSVLTAADNGSVQLQPATVIGTEVLTFTGTVVKGDHAILWCDGTNYYVTGRSRVVDAITLAAE